MSNLIKNIQNTVFRNNLFKKNDKIVLAVSGGPDSVCMLNVFSQLQKKYSLELIIAHINYGLRGKDSDADEKFVRDLAEKYNLEIFALDLVKTQNLASLHTNKKNSSENYLRNIRYDFFEKIRSENNFDLISVAHNANDQVETFLMRIIRGAGMSGLTAMKFKNGLLIRPLLTTPRKEILKYLKENKLSFRTDKTNAQNLYLRNKIRNKLIPSLEKDFNPHIAETISQNLISISEDSDLISKIVEKTFAKFSELKISQLKKLHSAIQKRILLKAIEKKRGNLKNIESAHIEEILKIINSTKNKIQTIKFGNLKIIRRGDKLEISNK